MGRDDAVRPRALCQRLRRGAVIHRQADVDAGNGDIGHDAVVVKGQLGKVRGALLSGDVGKGVGKMLAPQCGVVLPGAVDPRRTILRRSLRYGLGIGIDHGVAAMTVPFTADQRIQQHREAHQKQQAKQKYAFFHGSLLAAGAAGREKLPPGSFSDLMRFSFPYSCGAGTGRRPAP